MKPTIKTSKTGSVLRVENYHDRMKVLNDRIISYGSEKFTRGRDSSFYFYPN